MKILAPIAVFFAAWFCLWRYVLGPAACFEYQGQRVVLTSLKLSEHERVHATLEEKLGIPLVRQADGWKCWTPKDEPAIEQSGEAL